MQADGRAQQCVLIGISDIIPQTALVKQHGHAHQGMVDGLRVDKGTIPAQLLKAAYIVQKAAQPGQIDVLRRQGQAVGDALTQGGDAVGVVDLQFHFRVSGVVVGRVCGKGLPGMGPVKRHKNHLMAYCNTSHAGCKVQSVQEFANIFIVFRAKSRKNP